MAAVLRFTGHAATFASDGDEALALFDTAPQPFDLIITDHMMLRVSGLDLVRSLREKGFAGEIVVLTAYAGTIEEQEYRKLEVAGIMGKPFQISELREWLNCILDCRERFKAQGDQPCWPRAVNFCWLKHD